MSRLPVQAGCSDLASKAERILSAIRRIHAARTEEDACLEALEALDPIYPHSMISFLRTIGENRFIVGEKAFAAGEKWKKVAEETKRPCELPEDKLDLLPYILLVSNESRFVLDSREDPLNDKELCRQVGIISQYAAPLSTHFTKLGTLQLDMGQRAEKPVQECAMLDALAAHLSATIERHRLRERRQVLEGELLNRTVLIEWASSVANGLHGLRRSLLDYQKEHLEPATKNQQIRGNEEALRFLRETDKQMRGWISLGEQERQKVREIISGAEPIDVAQVVQDAVADKVPFLKRYSCAIVPEYLCAGVRVRARPATLQEILSCLIVNAAEAHARTVWIQVDTAACLIDPETDLRPRLCARVVVADDGGGVPLVFQDKIQKFGWTSKAKSGTGIGLTVGDLLTRALGGRLTLHSGGKSANQERTEFWMLIPAVS